MNQFAAKHVRRSHAIVLNGPPEVVFPLFTPVGEKLWVEGWNPGFLHPTSGATQEGMVFVTGHNEETTYWSLVKLDANGYVARYARVTPASRFGFVEVACEATGNGHTRATVTYTYTALTESGNRFIDEFTAESYGQMIDSWQQKVNSYLRINIK
ncbi:MAG: hypothetical protein ALAOOOJD_03858 [bacterium]|nr:hypothetical protein [bacterium]